MANDSKAGRHVLQHIAHVLAQARPRAAAVGAGRLFGKMFLHVARQVLG